MPLPNYRPDAGDVLICDFDSGGFMPMAWHHPMPHLKFAGWASIEPSWAKCDMVATVAFHRLNKPYTRTRHGRVYATIRLDLADLDAIRQGLRALLGL